MSNFPDTSRTTPGLGNPSIGNPSIGDRVSDAASTAASTLQEGRDAATDSLKAAKDYIGDKVGNLPGSDSVAATADYLRDHDMNQMAADLTEVVKRNPGPSLLVAGVLGFLVGRTLSR